MNDINCATDEKVAVELTHEEKIVVDEVIKNLVAKIFQNMNAKSEEQFIN